MAKKPVNENIISDLVNLIGEERTQYVLGVHRNTVYKWTIATGESYRLPNASAQSLAGLCIFLIQSCGWTIDEVVDSIESVNNMLAKYV